MLNEEKFQCCIWVILANNPRWDILTLRSTITLLMGLLIVLIFLKCTIGVLTSLQRSGGARRVRAL